MQLPSNEEQRKRLKGFIQEVVKEKTMIESCNEQIKVIRDQAKEEFSISPTDFNKLTKAAYDESFADKNYAEAEELLHSIEILYPKKD